MNTVNDNEYPLYSHVKMYHRVIKDIKIWDFLKCLLLQL